MRPVRTEESSHEEVIPVQLHTNSVYASIVISANVIMLHGGLLACLPTYVHLFSAAVARFITLAFFFRARCLELRRCCSQFSSVTPTPCGVLLRTRNERMSLGHCRARFCARTLRIIVPCVRTRIDTGWLRLAWTRSREKPHGKSLGGGRPRATIHTSSVCFCSVYLGAYTMPFSEHALLGAQAKKGSLLAD